MHETLRQAGQIASIEKASFMSFFASRKARRARRGGGPFGGCFLYALPQR